MKVDSVRAAFEADLTDQAPYHLNQIRRDAVLAEAEVPLERVTGDFKAYASRRLNGMRLAAETAADLGATVVPPDMLRMDTMLYWNAGVAAATGRAEETRVTVRTASHRPGMRHGCVMNLIS
jgi:hypothetical protein